MVQDVRKMVMTDGTEVEVNSVRQTRAGEVLLELRKTTAEARTSFSAALSTAVEADACSIKELITRSMLEIKNLDCCTTVSEVEVALRRELSS